MKTIFNFKGLEIKEYPVNDGVFDKVSLYQEFEFKHGDKKIYFSDSDILDLIDELQNAIDDFNRNRDSIIKSYENDYEDSKKEWKQEMDYEVYKAKLNGSY